ncbi:unnamed protein product [Aspergillus oryzae RIB40]|uniref:DNA, SC009 n=2 Tax=Aspergillus oryzae TaxID=5062 RepID=Q2UUP5_ASPOR|nr:unnamed protein product [Aspergillus oryzae RIB40]EIT79255.1 hypothetical protein Ao3042_04380 [Aspergillus oryzae 3.042]KDE83720.1 hypothetical protein AO1008_10369 [Aspergillus oryzae 100-8]BAE54720.1 unnamed protein product [Aspergillus oryzae RIB40]|eukprot:EIT79255.1 hypothetical protein Ao3042_04380 [Aspergillus oryzae 3.042]
MLRGQILGAQLDDDLVLGGVRLAHVCGVAEAENVRLGREGERLGKIYPGISGDGEQTRMKHLRLRNGISQAAILAYSLISRCTSSSAWAIDVISSSLNSSSASSTRANSSSSSSPQNPTRFSRTSSNRMGYSLSIWFTLFSSSANAAARFCGSLNSSTIRRFSASNCSRSSGASMSYIDRSSLESRSGEYSAIEGSSSGRGSRGAGGTGGSSDTKLGVVAENERYGIAIGPLRAMDKADRPRYLAAEAIAMGVLGWGLLEQDSAMFFCGLKFARMH